MLGAQPTCFAETSRDRAGGFIGSYGFPKGIKNVGYGGKKTSMKILTASGDFVALVAAIIVVGVSLTGLGFRSGPVPDLATCLLTALVLILMRQTCASAS